MALEIYILLMACNNLIREVNASHGIMTTMAGDGTSGLSGDGGAPTNAEISAGGVSLDDFGNLYIFGSGDSAVRKVSNVLMQDGFLAVQNVTTNDEGAYQAVVSSLCGNITSSVANIVVIDTNGLSYDWEMEYFGETGLNPTWDPDNDGDDLLNNYTNGTDPNVIQFSIAVTNNFVNTNMVPLQLKIQGGIPFYIALVDSTNFMPGSGETWYPYTSSNIFVNLAWVEGQHDLWVGLKGLPTNATVTWQETILTMETNPPVIVVTNPVANVVVQPLLQVQGFVDEQLSSITFDVSNSAGFFANQTGYVTSQFFDINAGTYTTNYFQLYDVRLTNGLNTVTIHATDLAGNTTTTNLSAILDYSSDTNPPVLNIEWPQNGSWVSGSNFTLQAQVDDITAIVTASINNQTNTGIVQRNGQVRGLTLPLSAGTNTVTVTATDAAGNSVTTNLTLVQSLMTLIINPVSADQLNQPFVTVTGSATLTTNVTINGVSTFVDNDGNWSANVPVATVGVMTVNATASDSSGNPIGSQALEQPQPPVLGIYQYTENDNYWENDHETSGWDETVNNGVISSNYVQQDCWEPTTLKDWTSWINGAGGNAGTSGSTYESVLCGTPPTNSSSSQNLSSDLYSWTGSLGYNESYNTSGAYHTGDPWSYSISQQTIQQLTTGGEGQPGTMQSYLVWVEAADYYYSGGSPLPPESLSILGHTVQDSGLADDFGGNWGYVVLQAPAGATDYLTVDCADPNYEFYTMATNLTLQIIDANTGTNLTAQANTVIVGQQMDLTCQTSVVNMGLTNLAFNNFQWKVPGYAISNYWIAPDTNSAMVVTHFPLNNTNVAFCWVDGGDSRTVQCSAEINGATITASAVFNVQRPMASITTQTGIVQPGINEQRSDYGVYFGTYGNSPGIVFTPTVILPSGDYNYGNTNYEIQWVQVIIPAYSGTLKFGGSNTVTWTKTTTSVVLDTTFPYGFTPFPYTDDSPGVAADYATNEIAASFSQKAEMWLMFQPANGQMVPLREVDWNCSGSITNNGSSWELISASWSTNPPDADTGTSYPTWTNNIANIPVEVITN